MSNGASSHAPGAGGQNQQKKRPAPPLSIVFFDPGGMFRQLARSFGWLRFTRYLVWPLAIFAIIICLQDWYALQDNLTRMSRSLGFLGGMLIGLIFCNLFSRFTSGTAMSMAEVDSTQFGVRLLMGLVPRFFIDRSGIKRLNFYGQRRQYSVALLTRLAVFGIGMTIWGMTRRSGTGSADFAMAIGSSGFMSFLFTANPLWFADGGMWMSAYFKRKNLRSEAFQVVGMVLRRRPLPSSLNRSEATALFFYAVACVVFTAAIALMIIFIIATALEAQLRGTGVVIFCIVLAIAILSLVSLFKGRRGRARGPKKRGSPAHGGRPSKMSKPANGPNPVKGSGPAQSSAHRQTQNKAATRPNIVAAKRRDPRVTLAPASDGGRGDDADEKAMNDDGPGKNGTHKRGEVSAQTPKEPVRAPDSKPVPPDPDQTPDQTSEPDQKAPEPEQAPRPTPVVSSDLDDLFADLDDRSDAVADPVLSELDDLLAPDVLDTPGTANATPPPPPPISPDLEALLASDQDPEPTQAEDLERLLTPEEEEAALDADPVMSDFEAVLAEDQNGRADHSELEQVLSAELEETQLDSDPLMSELESGLLQDEAEQAGKLTDELEALLSSELEEAELDADPVMSDLERVLDLPEDDPAAPLSDPAGLEQVLAAEIEETQLDLDPVMNRLEHELPEDDELGALGEEATREVRELEERDLDADPVMSELEGLLTPAHPAPVPAPAVNEDSTDSPDVTSAPKADAPKDDALSDPDTYRQAVFEELEEAEMQADPMMRELEDLLGPDPQITIEEFGAAIPTPEPGPARGERQRRRRERQQQTSDQTALVPTEDRTPARRRKTEVAPPSSGYDDLDRVLSRTGTTSRGKGNRLRRVIIWLLVLGGLWYVLQLPYTYEVGGDFVIQPVVQSQVRARTDGEIIEVRVEEGDWVDKDQVMAVLSNWDELRDVAVRKAEIDGLEADLQTLLAGAKPEEIALAQEAVDKAQVQIEIAMLDLNRKQQLFERGTITAAALESAESELKVAEAQMEEALAALRLVQTGARESEIASARAAISKNQEDLQFSELMLEQTNIRAVSDGQIVNSLDDVPIGAYLKEGDLFAVLEDNRVVIAEIEVPETDIGEVKIGAIVELKLWSESADSLQGEVHSIAPVAEEREFGRVVRVKVQVENPDGFLTSNTTGFGKIVAHEAPVWKVFTRVIFRFFRIELWSWIP